MATAPAPAALDMAALAAAYVKIRNAKHDVKAKADAEIAELDAKLETLANAALSHMNAHGMDNIKTEAGTLYRQEQVKPNIADDKAFYDWIVANDAVADALERRVKVGFVKEFMDNHDGLPPPGVSVAREYVVRVRKAG
jgi:hypothetical protein